jgi:SAM-dependent methyltransferase
MAQKRLIVRLIQPAWTRLNEAALRIYTIPPPELSSNGHSAHEVALRLGTHPKHDDNGRYEVPDYYYMRKVQSVLNPGKQDVVFDIGCGMGRFICLMAQKQVRQCVGVELSPQLCKYAQENARRLRGRKAPIQIVCADAATADLSSGTVYYMYNPFGRATMQDVLENIRGSVQQNPRNVAIAYYNSIHNDLFHASGWLEQYHEFKVQSGMPVTFWRNRAAQSSH